MKTILTVLLVFFAGLSFGQTQEVVIKTSAECGSCKDRIEEKLNYTGGVRFAEVDLKANTITVKYNVKKITLAELKTIITDLGYDADDMKAKQSGIDKLPACCKPGGMAKEKH